MPIEFTAVAVAFFDTNFSQASCNHFFLFEPICTAILLAVTSTVHVIRIYAIYDKSRAILLGLTILLATQIVVTAICCGFYRSVPLKVGQGCIAGPQQAWVGIYWLIPTILYITTFILAAARSMSSLQIKPLSFWKLMLRDGLNLYASIMIVNLANVIFWFVIQPTDPTDPIRTIVTSMAAVLTTSMTLRIILSVRGTLVDGGSFSGGASTTANSSGSRTTHVISTNRSTASRNNPHAFMLDNLANKPDAVWAEGDNKSSILDGKPGVLAIDNPSRDGGNLGVKITIDREIGYDSAYRPK